MGDELVRRYSISPLSASHIHGKCVENVARISGVDYALVMIGERDGIGARYEHCVGG